MSSPKLITQPNLSLAWAEAFLLAQSVPGHRVSPLTLTFTGLEGARVEEVPEIRAALNDGLAEAGMQRVQTVANTIFPSALWAAAKGDREDFYKTYRENLPEYVAFDSHKNSRGLYFGRLTAFDLDARSGERLPHIPEKTYMENGNQIEFIIKHCKKGVRVSEFQASVFDPARDHTPAAQLGFPCLQHITFVPNFDRKEIELNAFYATQQLFEKGYGNYLGLARLGHFVAGEVGLSLSRVSCFIGVEKMERKPKAGHALGKLVKACEDGLGMRSARESADAAQ